MTNRKTKTDGRKIAEIQQALTARGWNGPTFHRDEPTDPSEARKGKVWFICVVEKRHERMLGRGPSRWEAVQDAWMRAGLGVWAHLDAKTRGGVGAGGGAGA